MTIFKFVLSNQLGELYSIKSEVWAIPRGEYAIYLAMSGPTNGPDASEEEFASILALQRNLAIMTLHVMYLIQTDPQCIVL